MSSPSSPTSPNSEATFLGRWFTGTRREGFLARLAPEAWQTLCAVLSFTTGQGERRFEVEQLALALGIPRSQAEQRLMQLSETTWKGLPLLTLQRDEAGTLSGADLCPVELFARIQVPDPQDAATEVESGAEGEGLNGELAAIGLNSAQIASLRRRFSRAEVRRQLSWLPARGARNPAALLIRAIEQDWDEPKEAA